MLNKKDRRNVQILGGVAIGGTIIGGALIGSMASVPTTVVVVVGASAVVTTYSIGSIGKTMLFHRRENNEIKRLNS